MVTKMLYCVVAVAASIAAVDAATCTNEQVGYISSLYMQVATAPPCAPFAVYSADGVNINWKCDSNACTPIMMELASMLQDCEYASNGVNSRKELEDALYNQCKLCTYEQQRKTQDLWQGAAKTSACSPYVNLVGFQTTFYWPCSATGCTAVLKDLATKVPDCYTGGVNEKTRILKRVNACSPATPSPGTPSPGTPSPGTPSPSPSDDGSTSSPSSPSSNSGGSGSSPSPSSTSAYSNSTCSATEAGETGALYLEVAQSDACAAYSEITTYGIIITAPCTSPCVTQGFQKLATELDDCYYSYDYENKKEQVNKELDKCPSASSGRFLEDMATSDTITISYYSKDPVQAPVTSAPQMSAGPVVRSASAVVTVVALVVSQVVMFLW